MSTTSLELPQDVKELVATAAKHQGLSRHAFMIGAIRSAVTNAEKRHQFVADAVAARVEAMDSSEGYAADDVHAYLRARAQGRPVSKPKAKAWR